jgi:hypothetical protein
MTARADLCRLSTTSRPLSGPLCALLRLPEHCRPRVSGVVNTLSRQAERARPRARSPRAPSAHSAGSRPRPALRGSISTASSHLSSINLTAQTLRLLLSQPNKEKPQQARAGELPSRDPAAAAAAAAALPLSPSSHLRGHHTSSVRGLDDPAWTPRIGYSANSMPVSSRPVCLRGRRASPTTRPT